MPSYPAAKAAAVSLGFKDPQAVLDYAFLWQDWLGSAETISTHTITATTGITVVSSDINTSILTLDGVTHKIGSVVTVWLSGGTVDAVYVVACRITTNEGRTDERSMKLTVRNR